MPPRSSRKRKAPCDSDSDRSLVDDGHSPSTTTRVKQGFINIGAGDVKPKTTYHNITHNHGSSSPRQRTLLEALKFKSIEQRERTVEGAYGRTCEWFLETQEYQDWMASDVAGDSSKRLLWITGKAGTGKSTLMKFALGKTRDPSKRAKDERPGIMQSIIRYFRYLPGARASKDVGQPPDLVLSHFFSARGEALEKSTEGMYRTLLVQLLEQLPGLQDALPRGVPAEGDSWPITQLVSLLRESVKRLGGQPVVYYVDALDECNKSEVRKMVKVFEGLIQEAAESGQRLRVCFASRPYPHISSDLAVRLRLESQDAHRKDIKMYVVANLKIGNGAQAERIATQLLDKANGVFLWVVLVVERANEEHDGGRWDRYEEWLKGVPGDLNELYREMLEREISEEDKQAQMLLFQWLLFSGWGLSPWELWWGVQLGLREKAGDYSEVRDKVEQIRRWGEEMDDEAVVRYVGSISRGLAECVDNNNDIGMQVQFIHESAREFVAGEDGLLMKMTGAGSVEEMELMCNEEIKRGCERVLDGCSVKIHRAKSKTDMSMLRGENSILQYARYQILDKAEALQRKGQDQGEWLYQLHKRFQGCLWILWMRGDPESKVSMLDMLVWHEHEALLGARSGQMHQLLLDEARKLRHKGRAPGVRVDESDTSPLLVAFEFGRVEAVKYLVDVYLKLEQRPEPIQNTLKRLAAAGRLTLTPGREISWYRDPSEVMLQLLSGHRDLSGAMLPLAENIEELAIFFLVALTPPASLDDNLAQALQRHATQGYAATLNFIFKHNLPNHLIIFGKTRYYTDNTHWHLSEWAKKHKQVDLAATLRTPQVRSRFGVDTEDSEREVSDSEPWSTLA